MSRSQNRLKGLYAELQFTARALQLQLTVSKPLGDFSHYDLIVDNGRRLLRVQVRSAWTKVHSRYGISLQYARNTRRYLPSSVDFIAALVVPEDAWYIIPIRACLRTTFINLFPHTHRTRGRFELYREAWELLLRTCSSRPRITARPSPIRRM